MSDVIRVKVVALGNPIEIEAPAGTSAAQLRELVDSLSNEGLQLRHAGQTLSRDEEAQRILENGDTVVATAPAVKHG